MSSASHGVWDVRHPMARWAGLTALVFLAGCGGERRGSPGAGTQGAAVTDSAPVTPADTMGISTADTAAAKPSDTARPGSPRDTTAVAQAPRPATPSAPAEPARPAKPPATARAEPKPASPAQDTASAQDTAIAQAPAAARDTAPAESTASAQNTATAQGDTGTTQTADAPLRDEYHQAPRDTVDQATYEGWKQFNLNCARCHGEDVQGTTIAPHLILSLKPDGPINTQEAFVQVVCAGRPEKGMPSWCALGMDPAKINQIYSYVKGRSDAKLHPGRPARREEG